MERRQKCHHYGEIEVGPDSTETRSGFTWRQYISLTSPSYVCCAHKNMTDDALTRTFTMCTFVRRIHARTVFVRANIC